MTNFLNLEKVYQTNQGHYLGWITEDINVISPRIYWVVWVGLNKENCGGGCGVVLNNTKLTYRP